MTSQSAKELFEELNKQRIEVSKLRNTLNKLDNEKESWFKKKTEFSKNIKESIQKIKDNKVKRDFLTQEVKELKLKRDIINKEITSKLSGLAGLKKEKMSLAKSLNIKEPFGIKQDIEKLEFKIETEPMSFDKERSVMKKIKELKKLYASASIIIEVDNKIKETSATIRKTKKEANDIHKPMQEKAKQSQLLHEEILKISGEIDKIKIDEEESFKNFFDLKKQFNEANAQLKEKLKLMDEVKTSLDKISYERRERKRREQELFLKSKEEEVNEKIKRGEKLTTEDLLVFQKSY